ncbi:MAG: ABC transporter permease, partial [Bacillota bacterium]
YLLRRLVYGGLVVVGVVTLVFIIMRVIPGDPVALMLGSVASEETVRELSEKMGLTQPIVTQFRTFLSHALRGDFGESLFYREPALRLFLQRLPATAILALAAFVLSIVPAVLAGVIAGLRAGGFVDRVVSVVSLVAQSLPNYWVGLMLILVFARTLRLLPSSGYGGFSHLVLPAVTLAVPLVAVTARLVRSGILDILPLDFVRTARAKGLSERVVILKHVMKNLLIPVVTILGLQLGHLLGGAFIVETVFAWPGVGRLVIEAIQFRDYPVVGVCVMMTALVFVVVNILTDLAYAYLDPRIRYQ